MRIAERARNIRMERRWNPRTFCSRTVGMSVAVMLGGCMSVGDRPSVPVKPAPAAPAPAAIAEFSPPVVATPAVPPTPAPRPRRVVRETKPISEQATLRDKLVLIDPDKLIGMDPRGVQKLLGAPAQVKNDDLSREWVYASPGCSFRVFFYPNLNSASFRVLKYGSSGDGGELLDVSDVCVRRILTAKSNAEN